MEAIAIKSGTQLVHIPYGSSPQAVTALIRGDVQMACLPAISVVSQVAHRQDQGARGHLAEALAAAARYADAEGRPASTSKPMPGTA